MRNLILFFSTVLILLCVSTTHAQNSDPFGSSDPFSADPFQATPKVEQPNATKPAPAKSVARVRSAPKPQVQQARPVQENANSRIRRMLGEETTFSFVDTPLEEAIAMISRVHAIPMVIDRRALEDLGISSDTSMNIDLKNVSLRSFLRLMLRGSDLTYVIRNDVLQVTTPAAAESVLTTEAYPLPDSLGERSDEVIKALTGTIQPDMWEQLGGASSVNGVGHVLMVSTTESGHEGVIDFLQKLHIAFEKKQASR